MNQKTRTDKDSLGKVTLPVDALYGAYTSRVLDNYQYSNLYVPEEFLKNYIGIKRIYAQVNFDHKKLEKKQAESIINACEELLQKVGGDFMINFPIDRYQSGGGTSTNMNVNEVIANMADASLGGALGEYRFVHPNDHVNLSQSSNDTFPTTSKITTYFQLQRLNIALAQAIEQIQATADANSNIEKVGRTHLQDAVLSNLGQEFAAYAATLDKDQTFILATSTYMTEIPLGATAIGSLQNIDETMRADVLSELSEELGIEFSAPESFHEGTSSSSDLQKVAQTIDTLASDILKITSDLRLLNSGPAAGLSEIQLAPAQPGSSIMPGKVNPSKVESIEMAMMDIKGKVSTIDIATSRAQLQLQQYMPIIAWGLYDSIDLMEASLYMLGDAFKSLKVNKKAITDSLNRSGVFATDYTHKLGYDKVAELVHKSQKKGLNLKHLLDDEIKKYSD